jgi:hypothetical protein
MIWKTPEEARKKRCVFYYSSMIMLAISVRLSSGTVMADEQISEGVACRARSCAHWLWRPCDACDTGTVINRDGNNLIHTNCQVCKGTGHDGTGLGRCGLIHL